MFTNDFLKQCDQSNIFLGLRKISSTNHSYITKNCILILISNEIHEVDTGIKIFDYSQIIYMEPITNYFKNKNKYRFLHDEHGNMYLDVDSSELVFYQQYKEKLYDDILSKKDNFIMNQKDKVYLNYLHMRKNI